MKTLALELYKSRKPCRYAHENI